MTAAYWLIGRRIVEFEQSGEERAEYGTALVEKLAEDLTGQFGRGFSLQNLYRMRPLLPRIPARPDSLDTVGKIGFIPSTEDSLDAVWRIRVSIRRGWPRRPPDRLSTALVGIRAAAFGQG